jgi:phenylpyruvate tautomerase PptA (4-oxalocrotonate tautomerase family)
MPLVRIDLKKRETPGFGKAVGEVVYRTMVETINVPENDNFQIVNEHDPEGLVFDPGYLGIARTDAVIVIQITLNKGRSVDLKKLLYKRLAESLNSELNVRPEDVFVGLVEVDKENWSFGLGVAQYAE